MAESMAAVLPAQNVPPPRPPPPKFTSSKTTEDLISTKPRKPRVRKFHSMHGRAKVDKSGLPQRQVSLQEKLEENVTVVEDTSSTLNQVDEVDQPVVDRRKSPSKSPSRDSGGKASPVDGNKPLENGESGALTTKNLAEPVKPVEPVTQPQANTSSSMAKDTLQSNIPTASSKQCRSVSVDDNIALLAKSSVEVEARQRSKTLPKNIGTQRPLTDGVSSKKKPAKKTPPPPIPTRPPVIMQYQNMSSDGSTSQFRRSQSNSVSSHSSTPSIPEESTTPPLSPYVVTPSSPKVIPPSPDLCTPEIKIPEEVEDTNKPSSTELHSSDAGGETPSKAELSPTSKGRKKLLSGFKNTFRRRPKSPAEEKSSTLGAIGSRQPIIAHRRVKTVKEVASREESLPGGVIPPIIVQCVAYLNRPSSLNEEGLFRIPGDMAQIRALRDGFIAGKEMDLSDVLEPHNIAGLLKLHYREMRINLIPRGEMSREITRAAKARDVDAVKDVLSQLPSENLALIRVIVELLRQITDYSAKNQMTSGNLGASCGLSIFPTLQAGNASALLKCLVDYIDTVFPE